MKFFFDNTMPRRLADAMKIMVRPSLGEQEIQIVHLRDRFEQSKPDVEWIGELAQERHWIILSGDITITRRKSENEALRRAGLTAFFLHGTWSTQKFWEISWQFIRRWPLIVDTARHSKVGCIYEIPFGSSMKFKVIEDK